MVGMARMGSQRQKLRKVTCEVLWCPFYRRGTQRHTVVKVDRGAYHGGGGSGSALGTGNRELQYLHANSLQSCRLPVTRRTITHQAPLSMGFSRWEYWNGLPCPPPEDLPNPGIKPASPALQADSLPLSHQGSPSTPGTCSQTGVWQISPHVYFKSFFLHGFWVLCRDTFWRVCLGNSSKHTLQYFLLKFYRLVLCYVNNTFGGVKKKL